MSAITGIIHFNNEPVSIEHGMRLMSDLQKYPADDIQIWHKENVFLGCHAQWITPESVGEQLPFIITKSNWQLQQMLLLIIVMSCLKNYK